MRSTASVKESPQTLWAFFEQIDRVARCLPGVEDVEVIDSDYSRLRVTQALGPMSATFAMKMRITDRDPGREMRFVADESPAVEAAPSTPGPLLRATVPVPLPLALAVAFAAGYLTGCAARRP